MIRATPRREIEESSPMITWGAIEGEPVFLGVASSERSKSGYKLPYTPVREEISHKLVNKAQVKKREEKALFKK